VSHLTALSPTDLRRVAIVYHRLLGEHRDHLNALNVYPVPDADTGNNLHSTLGGVVDSLPPPDDDMSQICEAIRSGAMLGARGASGVITSQVLRAMADSLEGEDRIDGPGLAVALSAASEASYRAVLRPVEGTILTVVRAAAQAASQSCADHDGSLIGVLESARAAAARALENTPELLPALKAAGVVDAGGSGFLLLLDSFLHVADDRPLPEAPTGEVYPEAASVPEDMPRYEVVIRLEAPHEVMAEFRSVWQGLGNESTVVVEGDHHWVCHIHTNHAEAAIEAARAAGEVHDAQVTDLEEQILQLRARHAEKVAVVAVAPGSGIQDWFLSRGAAAVVAGGTSRNPSTAELLQAVETTGAQKVIILPNDENVVPAAQQVSELTETQVVVVPTSSLPGGMAALRRFQPGAQDAGVELMSLDAARVSAGGVTRAARDADSDIGKIEAGTWLTRSSDGEMATAPTLRRAVLDLLEALASGSKPTRIELITGEGSDPEVTSDARDHIAVLWPGADVIVIEGGQPHYSYLIGVESGAHEPAR
jgi:DAK2 domain fusion protein YloV